MRGFVAAEVAAHVHAAAIEAAHQLGTERS